MDLISRQAAIEPKAISEWKKEFREYVDSLDITRDDWKGIIEYINEIPSAQPEHTETHSCDSERTETHDWIPVTERLPEYGTEVLTINTDSDYEINHIIDEEDAEWFFDGVIAWMPLPEPYRGKQNENDRR